jgi:4-hydroxybenzoate polyprenyltransferase
MILATYFKLIRWKNLLLIIYLFCIYKFLFFKLLNIETNTSIIYFLTLLLAVLSITAAGYIINDIFDIKTDLINKPTKTIVSKTITLETAKTWYKTTNSIGIILGVALCIKVNKPTYSFIFMGIALLLYLYSKKIKSIPLLGNTLVSLLTAVGVLILPLFDINLIEIYNTNPIVIQLIVLLTIFSFFLNLLREILKDIEDINGDYSLNMNTLPILIGRDRTRKLTLVISLVPLILLVFIIFKYSDIYKNTIIFLFIFVLIPLLFFMIKLKSAKKKKEIQTLSTMLKIIMFLGISSLIIFSISY